MKSVGYSRKVDVQTLKQAAMSLARAMELFVKRDDTDAVAQAKLARRFLDEFIDRRD